MKSFTLLACLSMIVAGAANPQAPQEPSVVFRAEGRMVQVYATVLDHKGHYMDGLPRESFQIRDNGRPEPIVAFENSAAELSCAILLDTTGSMRDSLPTVKNALSRLIDEYREQDSVAVYGFSVSLELLQDFTRDKAAAKRAVMRTRAAGETALFDALTQVTMEIGNRAGKKAIIVFTDGDDNASVLNSQRVVERAKKSGIPVYTVAQGEARRSDQLMTRLKDIARMTGGKTYGAKDVHDAAQILQDVSAELQHTYLLSYRPPETKDDNWRRIQISLSGNKEYKDCTVRSKEGYYPN
jgi:Ca-activated chloride channel family protein